MDKHPGSRSEAHPRASLARAFRACPGLSSRMTLEEALAIEPIRRCLAVVVETQGRDRPRRKTWAKYFTSSMRT